jgi:hypothetical protein
VDLTKLRRAETRIAALLKKACGVNDEGEPRVTAMLVDRSRTRLPYLQPVPHSSYCESFEDYWQVLEATATNLRSVASDFETAWLLLQLYQQHNNDRSKLLKDFARAIRPGVIPLTLETGHEFTGDHPREMRWLRLREVKGIPCVKDGSLNHRLVSEHNDPKGAKEPAQNAVDEAKLRLRYLRAAAKILRSKFGKRIQCWTVLHDSYSTALYALVPYTPRELEEIRINRITRQRLWDAERAKVVEEEKAKAKKK